MLSPALIALGVIIVLVVVGAVWWWYTALPTFPVTGVAYNVPTTGATTNMNVLTVQTSKTVDPKLLGSAASVTITKGDSADPRTADILKAFAPYKGFIVGIAPSLGASLVALYPPPPTFSGQWYFIQTGLEGTLAILPAVCGCTCSVQSVQINGYWWNDSDQRIAGSNALYFRTAALLPTSLVGKDAVIDVILPAAAENSTLPLTPEMLASLSPCRVKITDVRPQPDQTTFFAVTPVPAAMTAAHGGSGIIEMGNATIWIEDPACPCCHTAPA
jgi:hypothetical protein